MEGAFFLQMKDSKYFFSWINAFWNITNVIDNTQSLNSSRLPVGEES